MNIEDVISSLSREAWGLISILSLLVFWGILFLLKNFFSTLKKATKENAKFDVRKYWNTPRLWDYVEKAKSDQPKYGYTWQQYVR